MLVSSGSEAFVLVACHIMSPVVKTRKRSPISDEFVELLIDQAVRQA
jgi:hypothetical protein